MLRQLLAVRNFFDNNIIGAMIKAPLDLIIGGAANADYDSQCYESTGILLYSCFDSLRPLCDNITTGCLNYRTLGMVGILSRTALLPNLINSASCRPERIFGNTLINGWTLTNRATGATNACYV